MVGMNIQPHIQSHMQPQTIKSAHAPERRGNSRFPVQEQIRYKILHSKTLEHSGGGTTLNISSGGILFTTDDHLPMGRMVELSVNWPARLGGYCPLKFVVVGRVVRSGEGKAAVRIQKYEFRTRGVSHPVEKAVSGRTALQ